MTPLNELFEKRRQCAAYTAREIPGEQVECLGQTCTRLEDLQDAADLIALLVAP